jgi:hypothetical protein
MKTGILLVSIAFLFLSPTAGQSSSLREKARITTILTFTDQPDFRQKGKLYDTYDAGISLINPYSYKTHYKSLIKKSGGDFLVPESDLLHFPVSRIDQIYLREDGNIIKGILVGAFIGSVTGYFIGHWRGDDPPGLGFTYTANQKSLQYGMGLGVAGGLAGGIIGANIRVELPIGGRQQDYRRLRTRLDIYRLAGVD